MSLTTATSNVILGGGGGYNDYVPTRKPTSVKIEKEKSTILKARIIPQFIREDEVFLFTVKDPIKSILKRLMEVLEKAIERYNKESEESSPKLDDIVIASGPMGYTSVMAFRPVFFPVSKSVFKSVIR